MPIFSPDIRFEDRVYQSFLQGLKLQWKSPLYAKVLADAAHIGAASAKPLETELRESSSAYRLYGWLERHLQQFKYLGRYGMLPVMERQAAALTAALDAAAQKSPDRLQLDPTLVLPSYFLDSDFHQHPGGIWSDDIDAFAYEWAANSFSFSMIAADGPYRWLAQYLHDRRAGDRRRPSGAATAVGALAQFGGWPGHRMDPGERRKSTTRRGIGRRCHELLALSRAATPG